MAIVSFLGLGNMGFAMASRLLRQGHQLNLYNRTLSRASPLLQQGARCHSTPAEACKDATIIISMLANDQASRAVWCCSDGVLSANATQSALAIECSTLSRGWVEQLATHCVQRGLRYIDAPVTGLPEAALTGQLTMLVGAIESVLATAHPLLSDLSAKIYHFGAVGTGTAYKLIINLLGAVQIASAAEALVMADRAGLDLGTVADAMSSSQAASPQVVRNVQRMIAADHGRNVVFSSALRQKDVEYALRFAQEIHASAPFGWVADGIYRDLCSRGLADANESSVIDVLRNPPAPTEN